MKLFNEYTPFRILWISLISAIFIIYPNITFFSFEHNYLPQEKHAAHYLFFMLRYLYFSALIWVLLRHNFQKILTADFRKRALQTILITGIAYMVYICFSITLSPKAEWYSGMLLFQFFVMFILTALVGHVAQLYRDQRRKIQEIEKLKIENLQSRYDALTNQINPHFFFNSLNGLTSLIRKKNEEVTLEYVNKLSDVFRYILQSDKKGLVTLGEELGFVQAFRYMMEVRFANKLLFNINVDKSKRDLKIPVLSLLPLMENVVVHNTIDSEHKMVINIWLNEKTELVVSNPVFPKLEKPNTNGIGLKNLEHRFLLLMNNHIRIENNGNIFTVIMPLNQD